MTDTAVEKKINPQWVPDKSAQKGDKDIILSLKNIKMELDAAYNAFNYVTDDNLVDSTIYKIESLQKKYEYYNKLAKKMSVHQMEN